MTEILFGVLLTGLKLWESKESRKYLDKVIELRQSWIEEYSKPRGQRDNETLDEIETQLYLISKVFSEVGNKK
jgi:hypothetical protein